MDVFNSKLGELAHHGMHLREQGRTGTPPVMGPPVFEELARAIDMVWRHWHAHCAPVADMADNPVPNDVHYMLRNHGHSRFWRRVGQAYQQRLGMLVHSVMNARLKRAVHVTDTCAAAQMELRTLPGALVCLSATGSDSTRRRNAGLS